MAERLGTRSDCVGGELPACAANGLSRPSFNWNWPNGPDVNPARNKAEQLIAFTTTCVVIDLTTAIALSAAELQRTPKLATADAIVYATAWRSRPTC